MLSKYLTSYLPGRRNVSSNTVRSYRDTFRLLLMYCQDVRKLRIEKLALKDIDEPLIVGFIDWLGHERHNGTTTQNQRLACIHGFCRYAQIEDPVGLLSYQRVLSIPMKKAAKPTVNHLTPDALKLILAQPDLSKASGRRDLTLLSLLYDTGARVQELVDLKVRDVRLEAPPVVILTGKGRKTRQVPLMPNTHTLLKRYMDEFHLFRDVSQDNPLFMNRMHGKLTTEGVNFILNKYVSRAREVSVTIPERVTPHVLRHTKAMHLLQAGVNLIYIRDLLGHVDISTTEIYARADTELKRKALETAYPSPTVPDLPEWSQDESLLAWLDKL
ncbi:tyrosine-type recombinase/integrase [Alicyclobacillus dauci]|uniref:Tyrosine-type recombinase/integrase n=1 Tax=Alicyclobacillus dauci TaxID=1475485 RepID=A0ABY6Z9J5_9BACL|nr:tyrosine-type recombinase/integrase [Alicyclobacillus dauci]WAH38846.1 tyrosine-type recombinase/integrase [Alicyclobacillus dauci]